MPVYLVIKLPKKWKYAEIHNRKSLPKKMTDLTQKLIRDLNSLP